MNYDSFFEFMMENWWKIDLWIQDCCCKMHDQSSNKIHSFLWLFLVHRSQILFKCFLLWNWDVELVPGLSCLTGISWATWAFASGLQHLLSNGLPTSTASFLLDEITKSFFKGVSLNWFIAFLSRVKVPIFSKDFFITELPFHFIPVEELFLV